MEAKLEMSAESTPEGEVTSSEEASSGSTWRDLLTRLDPEEWAIIALALVSLIGFALTRFSGERSFRYWLYVSPLFAAASITMGWARARRDGDSVAEILKTQILHWAVLPVAVFIIYRLQISGRLDRQDAGLVTLLAIALTTLLAGVHFDWRLALLGSALGVGTLAAVLIEEFFWVFVGVGLLLGALAWWLRRPNQPASS